MFTPVANVSHGLSPQFNGGISCSSSANVQNVSITTRLPNAFVEIIEQPDSVGARFRYKCEGRSAGCIRGTNSTEKHKTYPTIKVHGYQGTAGVVVSCVTKDGPPHYPHPHNLIGKTCTNGVCYKSFNTSEICSFTNLGIQCVKKKDIKESLSQRQSLQVDPFGTGFQHSSEPNKINLNTLRLCFQVFIADASGKLNIPLPPVISNPIFDNKTVSDLTISKLSHYSAPVTGGQEMILLCDQINKDDIQIVFYEESSGKVTWTGQGKFGPHHVHRKAAIWFVTPSYKNENVQQCVDCFVQLRRPSDGAIGKPKSFKLLPLKQDPEGMLRKRNKFEALRLDHILHFPDSVPKKEDELITVPRVIRHAVRSKVNAPNWFPGDCIQISENQKKPEVHIDKSTQECGDLNEKVLPTEHTAKLVHSSPHHKVEDALVIAAEQINVNNIATEPAGDDTLEKLNSLDLGFDPSELDVNLSGITLDSFSEVSGLNFSASEVNSKDHEKLHFNEKHVAK